MIAQSISQLEHALEIEKSTLERQTLLKQLYHLQLEQQQSPAKDIVANRVGRALAPAVRKAT